MGPLPPGLSLASDGTWTGGADTAGSYPITLFTCDNQTPPACTIFEIVLEVSLLPATGAALESNAMVGLLLLLVGLLALVAADFRTRRHSRASGQ